MPLVSVIIPAFNAEGFILRAVQSVLDQGYAPIEILLVDDGSTDRTVEIVQRETPQVRIIQQSNAGVAAARNTGIHHASGELICFLDADDGWFPGKLTAQVHHMQKHEEVGLCFHNWLVWAPDANGLYSEPQQPKDRGSEEVEAEQSGWVYHKLLLDCFIHTSSVMLRRNIAEQAGCFDTSLINGEDYDYWLRISRICEISKLAGVYSFYRAVAGSLSSTPKSQNFEYLVIQSAIRRWGLSSPDGSSLTRERMNSHLAKLSFRFGYSHYHGGSPRLAVTAFLAAIKHEPMMWRALPYLAASQVKRLLNT